MASAIVDLPEPILPVRRVLAPPESSFQMRWVNVPQFSTSSRHSLNPAALSSDMNSRDCSDIFMELFLHFGENISRDFGFQDAPDFKKVVRLIDGTEKAIIKGQLV